MKKKILFALVISCLLFSCGSREASVKNEPVGLKTGTFGFAYVPYDKKTVPDPSLYNYVFNIIRNKLVYYVRKTLTSDPDPLGMVLELEAVSSERPGYSYADAVKTGAVRGWTVFDTDIIPIPDRDVAAYNSGSVDRPTAVTPKACYSISISGNNAVVYVRYWILQYRNYGYIHHLARTTNWSVVRTEVME